MALQTRLVPQTAAMRHRSRSRLPAALVHLDQPASDAMPRTTPARAETVSSARQAQRRLHRLDRDVMESSLVKCLFCDTWAAQAERSRLPGCRRGQLGPTADDAIGYGEETVAVGSWVDD